MTSQRCRLRNECRFVPVLRPEKHLKMPKNAFATGLYTETHHPPATSKVNIYGLTPKVCERRSVAGVERESDP